VAVAAVLAASAADAAKQRSSSSNFTFHHQPSISSQPPDPESMSSHHHSGTPQGRKKFHRDWRFITAGVIMIVAMIIYVLNYFQAVQSLNLAVEFVRRK